MMARKWDARTVVLLCVLMGFVAGAAQAQQSPTKMLADFEDGSLGIYQQTRGRVVDSKHLDGKAIALEQRQNIAVSAPKIDWDEWNVIKADAWNPSPTPARLHFCFKDDSAPHGYFSWINRYVSVAPGRSTIRLYVPELKRGEGSPKDMLDTRPFHWDKLQWWGIASLSGDVELDNLRVEKVTITVPEGVRAFDFGPPDQPVFPGTVGVSPDDVYTDAKGFGWSEKRTIYARKRHSAPDNFVRDWISGNNSTFSVKVPNGAYRVWLMWADPGEWELVQHAEWRKIDVEGRTVLSERMTGPEFLDFYFHFAETEDLPGEDIYQKYVEWRYKPATFDVVVADGRLDLTIAGPDQYACTVNGLVIFSHAKMAEGTAYLSDLAKRRREAFSGEWHEQQPAREKVPEALAKKAASLGYIVYRRPLSANIDVWDAPKDAPSTGSGSGDEVLIPGEVKTAGMPGYNTDTPGGGVSVSPRGVTVPGKSIGIPGIGNIPDIKVPVAAPPPVTKITAAGGEYEPFSFSVYALRDLPHIAVQVEPLKTDDGRVLPADVFDVRVVRYKFKRIGFAGAGVYGVQPWILVDGKVSSVKKDMTRRWWVTAHVPMGQPPGIYKGKVNVTGSASFSLPIEVRVLPIELPEADMGLGMFGMGGTAPYFPYYAENRERNEADKRKSLECARDHGFTYWAIHRGMSFTRFDNGKAQYDVSAGRAQVELARRLGFTVLDMYGDNRIGRQALDDKGALAKQHGFATTDDLVKEVFGAAKRAAAEAGLPDPIWSFGDEPPDTQAPVFVAMHRRMRDLANARSEISWSPHGEPTHELLDVTSVASLNVTNMDDIKRAQEHGNTVYLNNQGRGRWAYGLYMWKAKQAGVKAFQQFCWMGTHADPYYPLDSYEDDGGHVYPDRQGNLRPKVDLERVREGIDDYRYTVALTRAVDAAKDGAKKDVAAEAKAYLDSALARLKFEDTKRDKVPQMSEAELNAYRAKVQEYILKLVQ